MWQNFNHLLWLVYETTLTNVCLKICYGQTDTLYSPLFWSRGIKIQKIGEHNMKICLLKVISKQDVLNNFFLQNNITCNFLCRSLIYVLYFRRLEICPVLFASLSIVWFYVERRGSHVWRVGVTVVAKWKARTVFYF